MEKQFVILCWIYYRMLDIYEPEQIECRQAKERAAAFYDTIIAYRC